MADGGRFSTASSSSYLGNDLTDRHGYETRPFGSMSRITSDSLRLEAAAGRNVSHRSPKSCPHCLLDRSRTGKKSARSLTPHCVMFTSSSTPTVTNAWVEYSVASVTLSV